MTIVDEGANGVRGELPALPPPPAPPASPFPPPTPTPPTSAPAPPPTSALAPPAPSAPAPAPPARAARWLGVALVACGAATLPWLVVLARTLPETGRASHWAVAWVGLDALEALGLAATGLLLLRGDRRRCLTAAATAVLLVVDAWFDVTTSAPGPALTTAVVMAAAVELPLAVLCAVTALRACREP